MTLQAHSVGYTTGTAQLVSQVSLSLTPGELLVLAGPNGAGKTTLLRLLSGDLSPTAGEVTLHGHRVRAHAAAQLARTRAVLAQQHHLQFAFTVDEVVRMGRHPQRGRTGDAAGDLEVVEAAMAQTDTRHLARRSFPTLSGGEQRRVALARALAQDTPVLLLDEPTAALDIHHQQLVMSVARQRARHGAAVLAVLHDLNLAAAFADRIALLHRGGLAALGAPWQVLTEVALSEVFDHPISIGQHPARGTPLVIPLPADTATVAGSVGSVRL